MTDLVTQSDQQRKSIIIITLQCGHMSWLRFWSNVIQ